MSASLVGSEMCIRDRGSRTIASRRRSATHAPWDSADAIQKLRSGCADAVSYTHLTLPTICSV
eukprot:15342039-Alexandrium_andersonii.AAC.1